MPRQAQADAAACNAARAAIISALGETNANVNQIADANVQAAAQAGLATVQTGIGQVAQSVIAGEAPSQEGRDNVQAGLTAVSAALQNADA